MSFWEDILEFILRIFPCEHEDLDIRSFFPIHDTTSTLLIELCLRDRWEVHEKINTKYITEYSNFF